MVEIKEGGVICVILLELNNLECLVLVQINNQLKLIYHNSKFHLWEINTYFEIEFIYYLFNLGLFPSNYNRYSIIFW